MKMKLISLAITALVLAVGFVSCKEAENPEVTSKTTTTESGTVTTTPTSTTSVITTPTTAVVTTSIPKITVQDKVTYTSPDSSLVNFDIEKNDDLLYYNNPTKLSSTDPVKAYFSDPFVMRYDGSYYLYSSGTNNKPVWVHKSDDLINWDIGREALSAEELPAGVNEGGAYQEICMSAYAPEVVYCNGLFVMVTSPGGMGHYIYTSESPLGPFKQASENFGCKIDGDIFIDNDGKWYFYYANGQGIQCRPMLSPTEVDMESSPIATGAIIDEGGGTWTEGSMIVYHDGIYYMTYTGNHTGHTAYRVEYGISYDGPTKFKRDPDSQIFVSTTSAAAGIGHSSSVKGPDLDSYYLAYHTRSVNGKSKDFNIDRIIFNGEEMIVLGPTVSRAANPSMPDIYSLFDAIEDAEKFEGSFTIEDGNLVLGADARVYAKEALSRDQYTIEATFRAVESGAMAGVIFGYKDDNNYGSALFDTAAEELVITFIVNGEKTEYREKLVRSFDIPYDFSVLQGVQIEKAGKVFTFYVNDRILAKHESDLSGRKVGVMTVGGGASVGYFGATAAVGGNSNKDFYKPVASQTGYILATHCREWDITTGIKEDTKGLYLVAKEGESYNYSVYAEASEKYTFAAAYRSKSGAKLSIFVDGVYINDIVLKASEGIATEMIRGISMDTKSHVITVYVREGDADIFYYSCLMNSANAIDVKENYDIAYDKRVSYSDGVKWEIKDGELKMSGKGKRLYGSNTCGDYIMSVDVRTSSTLYEFGLLLRTVNPAEPTLISGTSNTAFVTTAEGAAKGANWMQGYYLEFTKEAIVLYKVNYSKNLLKAEVYRMKNTMVSKQNNIAAVCNGATLSFYINGILIGEYTDPEPFINGMAGLRCSGAAAVYFDNFKITQIK